MSSSSVFVMRTSVRLLVCNACVLISSVVHLGHLATHVYCYISYLLNHIALMGLYDGVMALSYLKQ